MSLVMGPNSCPGIGLSLTHPRWQKWDRPHQWLYLPRQCPVWKSYTGPKQLTPLLCLEVNSYPWKRKEAHSFQHRVLVGPRTFFFFFLWSCSMCFFLLKQKPRSAVVVCYIWVFFFLFFFFLNAGYIQIFSYHSIPQWLCNSPRCFPGEP